MRYLRPMSQQSTRMAVLVAWLLAATTAQSAVLTYTISSNNDYLRERVDVSTGSPVVIDTRTSVSGQFTLDTASGELISASFALADYNETYDWNPLALPWFPVGSADLAYTGEVQTMTAGVLGVVDGTTISFSGANAWSGASVAGGVNCSNPIGSLGADVCNSAALTPWSAFEIELGFSSDFSMVSATANWNDSDALTTNTHQLQLFAVQAVPLPAAGWLMMSALIGLGVVSRKKQQ